MWKISEVKEKGREAFKANYWMCVLVALIVAVISGGIGGGFRYSGGNLPGIFNRNNDKNGRYEKDIDDFFDKDRDYYDYDYDDYDYDDDTYSEYDKYGNITLMQSSYYSEKYEYTYYRDGRVKTVTCYYYTNDDFIE